MDNKDLKKIADELRLIRKELQKIRSAIIAEQPVSIDRQERYIENRSYTPKTDVLRILKGGGEN